ncbi:3-methyl-2-oxobutanoate hydroxymethyltransferase [Litorivivens sp.]|uniref:3-methyl-2-oxobutanoate hydroxymethyltransferase n=1 Tax=Litorivivens sp. TaxID=2020868 RepID=UPI003567891F
MNKISPQSLLAKKANGEKFAVLTAYDATFARAVDQAGIDVILVGDSLGNVLQGHTSTLPVTVDDMCYHTACVNRGTETALIVSDLPFGSYNTIDDTLRNATALMQSGAHMVKLEGGQWLAESISLLTERGIPVCGHLGLTPQSVNTLGGFKVQGRDEVSARRMITDAKTLEDAGASLLVIECVPTELGERISEALSIPVIGIGAGPKTDAQVLVLHDLLGISRRLPKFVKNFLTEAADIPDALTRYREAVERGEFPGPEHSFS